MPAMTNAERRSIEKWMDEREPDPICPRCDDPDCVIQACTDPFTTWCRCGQPRVVGKLKCAACIERAKAVEKR